MTSTTQRLSIWHYWWGLIRCHPGIYALDGLIRIVVFAVMFQAIGLITRAFFDALTGNALLDLKPWSWAALLVLVTLARGGLIFASMYAMFAWIFSSGAVMRKNMFEHILDRPGANALPSSTGEAISRFRGDVDEVADFTTEAFFLVAQFLFAVIAVAIMIRINLRITLFVFLPLVGVVGAANLALSRIQRYREASRGATGNVTGFIGEMFDAVQAIKVATAEERMLTRFRSLNETRRQTVLKDRLFNELLESIFHNTTSLGIGAILLLAGQSLQDGSFTVGDFSLFVFYLFMVTDLTAIIGMYLARFRQVGVSLARIDELIADAPPETLVAPTPVYLRSDLPAVPYLPKTAAHRLETLTVTDLSYRYPDSQNGIQQIDLTLKRGSFTVVTGRIGSGKTILLRTLLGLLPKDEGTILWNQTPVSNPATFLVPPRIAYTAQIPALFSETLKDNILLGLPEDQVDLESAIEAAVMQPDLAQMEKGLETIVGPRGVKLSGGQKQRTAAARMFVRAAELLVFDDLSSALDVNTERKLWDRLFAQQTATCLVVSHRRPALRQADHIIVLKDGKIEDEGT